MDEIVVISLQGKDTSSKSHSATVTVTLFYKHLQLTV